MSEGEKFYTIAPFGDEWSYDPATDGREPLVLGDLGAVRWWCGRIRDEYASMPDVDQDWISEFWFEVLLWPERPKSGEETHMTAGRGVQTVGWVTTPDLEFHPGVPQVDKQGNLQKHPEGRDWPLKLEVAGIVYRVEDAGGGVLTDDDQDRVAKAFADLGFEVKSHQYLRVDGCHIVEVAVS